MDDIKIIKDLQNIIIIESFFDNSLMPEKKKAKAPKKE